MFNQQQINEIAAALREAVTKFLVPLQTRRVIDEDAFDQLRDTAKQPTYVLKEEELVQKSLLGELYGVAGVIHAEAPFFRNEQLRLEKMAYEIELYFSLILKGEVPEQRVPGIPRIL